MTIKRIFISYSFANREKYRKFHEEIKQYFSTRSIEVYAFVFDFQEKVNSKELMKAAFSEIDKSDLLLAELSDQSVGVGLEVGYAKAKGIKTAYLFKKDTKLQETIVGTTDFFIEYNSPEEVVGWFKTHFP